MKMNYSYNEMKRAFECGRNFQLTGENNFQEIIEELNQALRQPPIIKSVCDKCEELQAEVNRCYEAMDAKKGIIG